MVEEYKYLHIFSDAPYTHKFICFIKEYFDETEHCFIILYSNEKSKFLDFYKTQENCILTTSKNIYFDNKEKFQRVSQILIHQLNKPTMMATLSLFYPSVFEKMVWVIWGGDVYFYKYKTNSLKDNLLELLRKYTIKKFPVIVSYIKGDYEKVVEIYHSNAKYIKAWYPSPIDVEMIKKVILREKTDNTTRITVGNSADPSNDHIEAFNMLAKYKNEDIEVSVVLSYGGGKEYIEQVIQRGKELFADKFKPILEYMSFEDYLDFINQSDICLLNHKRQQGLGNQLVFFILKKKVFISETTTPFKYYKENGVDIYSTESLVDMSFEDFVFQKKELKNRNREVILNDNDKNILKEDWNRVFKCS